MRNVLDNSRRENENTFYAHKYFSENCTVYDIISKNVVATEGS